MSNPFDNADGAFVVLVNHEGQHSLWPEFVPVPGGWTVVKQTASRQECLDHIEENWTDIRPRTLVAQYA
jgi:MbtH protein